MQILTPDLEATEELDLFDLVMSAELERADKVMRHVEPDGKQDAIDAYERIESDLELYREHPDGPRITIGYIPAWKLTELQLRTLDVLRPRGADSPEFTADQLVALAELNRSLVRWGVKGHTIEGVEFDTEKDGRHIVAGPRCMDLYERNGWLQVLADRVREYNQLSKEKKTESLPKHGTSPATLTAESASSSPH